MKTREELQTFCEGYLYGLLAYADDTQEEDGWAIWGGYDINFSGADYSSHVQSKPALRVDAYKAGWTKNIGDPIHSFTIELNDQEQTA